ncbi:MAG: rRNA maturation RNase YbeY [Verrucomicrobia bacterium]|nr:MAG: rRNA maturation RNase YbeY [Verrucomicrobiota bacterium]
MRNTEARPHNESTMIELSFRNLQRRKRLNTHLLHQLTHDLISRLLRLDHAVIGFQFVSSRRMAEVNWDYLQHEGPTDVITFGYEPAKKNEGAHGDIYICVEVAESQSTEFGTSWQQELIRYLVHGILHLLGFDDQQPAQRRTMKREENRLVRHLEASWDVALIQLPPILPHGRT